MRDEVRKDIAMLCIIGLVPVIWIALLVAPYSDKGLVGIIENFPKIIENPYKVEFCQNSIKTVFVFYFFFCIYSPFSCVFF